MAGIKFDITGENKDFLEKMQQSVNAIKNSGDTASNISNEVHSAFGKAFDSIMKNGENSFSSISQKAQDLKIAIEEDALYLKKVENAQTLLNKAFQDGTVAQGDYIEKSAQLSTLHSEVTNRIKDNTQALKEETTVVEETNVSHESFMDKLSNMPGMIGACTREVQSLTLAAKAFIATPVGMIIGAISLALSALTTWFKRTTEGQKVLRAITAGFTETLNILLDAIDKVGKYLYDAFTNPKKAMTDFVNFLQDQVLNRVLALGNGAKAIGEMINGDFKKGLQDWGNAIAQSVTGVKDAGYKLADGVSEANGKIKESISLNEKLHNLNVEAGKLELERKKTFGEVSKIRDYARKTGMSNLEKENALNAVAEKQSAIYEKIKKNKEQILDTQ